MERKQKKKYSLKRIGIILVASFTLLMGLLYSFQERLIFLPTKLDVAHGFVFEESFKELILEASDGAQLNALHFTREQPEGIIVYFHGNAGNLQRWGNIVQYFVKKNWEVVVMDYRGYGKSTGERSEQALFSDAQLFYEYALRHFNEEDIMVYGRSLGAAIATRTAAQNNPGQLVLETPFYNLYDVAKERFPLLPVKRLLKYRFESNEHVQQVFCPITIIHGTEDRVVPYDSGKKLFDSIGHGNKKMVVVQGGFHNNLIEFQQYQEEIDRLLCFKNI